VSIGGGVRGADRGPGAREAVAASWTDGPDKFQRGSLTWRK
jgi:hypothetical protein